MKCRIFSSMKAGKGLNESIEINVEDLTELEKKQFLYDLNKVIAQETEEVASKNKANEEEYNSFPGERIIQGHTLHNEPKALETYDLPKATIDEQPTKVNAEIEIDARSKASERIISQLADLGWK